MGDPGNSAGPNRNPLNTVGPRHPLEIRAEYRRGRMTDYEIRITNYLLLQIALAMRE
jgi:hypothetical protein